MAIRLKINGVPIKCDTAEEATAILLATSTAAQQTPQKPALSGAPRKPDRPTSTSDGEGKFPLLWKEAEEEGRQLLKLAVVTDGDLFVSDLPEKLGVDPNRANWVRRKLAELATAKGVDLDAYLPQSRVNVDGKPKTVYQATRRLREAIKGVGGE